MSNQFLLEYEAVTCFSRKHEVTLRHPTNTVTPIATRMMLHLMIAFFDFSLRDSLSAFYLTFAHSRNPACYPAQAQTRKLYDHNLRQSNAKLSLQLSGHIHTRGIKRERESCFYFWLFIDQSLVLLSSDESSHYRQSNYLKYVTSFTSGLWFLFLHKEEELNSTCHRNVCSLEWNLSWCRNVFVHWASFRRCRKPDLGERLDSDTNGIHLRRVTKYAKVEILLQKC